MKSALFGVMLFLAMVCVGQQELEFPFRAGEGGVPVGWIVSGKPDVCAVKDGVVTISGNSTGNIYIYRSNAGLAQDVTYILSCQAKCAQGGDYMIYYEYMLNGKWKSHIFRTTGNGEWQNVSIRFGKQETGTGERIMLRLMNDTTLEVRELKIVEENHNHGVTDSFPPSAPITRFIHNGSFEWREKYWNILSDARVVRSDDDFGNTALQLGKDGFVVQQSIHLLPKRRYRITWYGKAEKDEEGVLRLALRYMPEKQLFSDKQYVLTSGPYRRFAIDYTTPDTKDPVMDIILKNEGQKPLLLGQFYLKEFSDEETAPLRIKLHEPHYRNAIYASMPCKAIRGRVEFGGDIDKAEVVFSRKGGKVSRQAVTPAKPEFEFSARELADGEHPLTVSATIDGKVQEVARKVIHKYPHKANEIVIGKDNNFYCDGKRYFPFMMGRMFEHDDVPVMSYLCSRRGMSGSVRSGIGDARAALMALDKAQRFGLKTMLWIGGDFANTDDYEVSLRKLFERIMTPEVVNHPALFAYNYCDEPWAREIPAYKFEAAMRIMRELDPYHPFFINESPRGVMPEYLADYAQYSDIYGVDLYPLPAAVRHSAISDKSMAAVGKYSEIYNVATGGEKPVLMWLQGFQWHPDESPLAVFPNAHELKFMCMDSLMHGTKAILMFNSNMLKQRFYNDLFSISGLVSQYEQVIATGKAVTAPLQAKGLRANSYNFDGDTYHLLLNESAEELAIDAAPFGGAKLVYGEDMAKDGGKFMLRPWGFAVFSENGSVPKPFAPLAEANKEFDALEGSFIKHYQDYFDKLYNERTFLRELAKAEWIWYPGSVSNNPKVSVERTLKFAKPVKSVIVFTTVD
ncbi:MAG: hypothetical protein IJS15_06905, partial [Victivallales bacterium]|nr:hypothetical protein [Victivallales bacterium]